MEELDQEREGLSEEQSEYLDEVMKTVNGFVSEEEMKIVLAGFEEDEAPDIVGELILSHRVIEPVG